MKNVVVVGSQWGDEGKGKIVDWLSDQADVIIRFQGGHNAGHTLVIDGTTYKLRLLPSGIVRKNKISIIGNGVVIDPWALLEEIEEIKSKGVEVNENNLIISESANLILPFHRELDGIREDTEVMLHLMGGPGPARRILFQGSRLRGVHPDERAIAGQIGKALREPVPSIGHFIELHPGFLHSGGNIEQTIIEWKRDDVELCVLDASGELFEPKSHSQEKIGFLLSDDQPFSVNEVEMMENLPVVSLGQKWLQGHSCIAIIHHLMDSQ